MVEKVTEISSVCENLTAHDAMIIHAFDVLIDAMSQAPHGRRLLKLCRHRKKAHTQEKFTQAGASRRDACELLE